MIAAHPKFGTKILQRTKGACSETLKRCNASMTKLPPNPSVPLATQTRVCSKRQVLLGGVSLMLAPLIGQEASAKPSLSFPGVDTNKSADGVLPSFKGFDGVGGASGDYANAELREIALGNGGGVASVHVEGFEQLMPIFIGVAEAAALVYATSGEEGRRPSTLGTWRRSLEATGSKVERVVITRLEDHTYYSRIVLLLPGGVKRSVDARPSDSLALALQCQAPLFVARQLAQEQQEQAIDAALAELEELEELKSLEEWEGELRELKELEKELEELDPETAITPQEASLGGSKGLQAMRPAKPLTVTATGMQDMEDCHSRVCATV